MYNVGTHYTHTLKVYNTMLSIFIVFPNTVVRPVGKSSLYIIMSNVVQLLSWNSGREKFNFNK